MTTAKPLKRTLSLWQVTLYGIGTILGAGIYVLIGEVAAVAGLWAPVSFVIAALLAAFTGLSYAELASRFPVSAGEAVYVKRAFDQQQLSLFMALSVVLTGVVSSATLVNGFVGYLGEFVAWSPALVIPMICLLIGVVAAWGISESVALAVAITVLEILGLLAVVVVALPIALEAETLTVVAQPLSDAALWLGVLSGAGIAFYAFIGFEDMVNIAEEVKDVRRVLPKAIVITLVVTAILYVVVAVVVILSMPLAELSASHAPLAAVYAKATGSSALISIVALFAVINGALIQVLMAARVLYGAANQGWLPRVLAGVHSRTRTPVVATAAVTVCVLIFALWLPLGTLARLTSFIILLIFAIVNLALLKIKMRAGDDSPQHHVYHVPMWIPALGAVSSALFALLNGWALLQ